MDDGEVATCKDDSISELGLLILQTEVCTRVPLLPLVLGSSQYTTLSANLEIGGNLEKKKLYFYQSGEKSRNLRKILIIRGESVNLISP